MTLRLVFKLPLRQTEGFLRLVLSFDGRPLEAPDHTTLSRRSQHLAIVVPPNKMARVSRRRPRSSARDRTITKVKMLGRRRWKKKSGYHREARVENAFFRYKSIIGDDLRARTLGGQEAEALLACNVLNRMSELGRPKSYSIGR